MGRFWVLFLSHAAADFQWWFHFHLYKWVVHWGLVPEAALEFAPMRFRCGSGAASWVAGVLAAPGTKGVWWLEKQEI